MLLRKYQFRGTALGLLLTLTITALYFFDVFERPENIALDFRQKHFSQIDADSRIVHVDIDDGSVDKIGRWPDAWPRDLLAELVRSISDGGASVIAVDLLFDEPQ